MTQKKQINLVVDSEQKAEWEEYSDESTETESLSHLIRLAVEKEIVGRETAIQSQQSKDNGEVLQAVNRVEKRINDIDNRLTAVEQSVKRPPEQAELANEIFTVLPPKEVGSEAWEKLKLRDDPSSRNQQQMRGDNLTAWEGTIESIARHLDEDEEDVEKAVEQLLEDTRQVRVTEYNGEKAYYKDE